MSARKPHPKFMTGNPEEEWERVMGRSAATAGRVVVTATLHWGALTMTFYGGQFPNGLSDALRDAPAKPRSIWAKKPHASRTTLRLVA